MLPATLHALTGLIPVKSGSIVFEGKDITKVPGYKLVSMGIAHVPEGRRVFAQLTVLQNLKMGAYTRNNKQESEETIQKIYKRFPRLPIFTSSAISQSSVKLNIASTLSPITVFLKCEFGLHMP